MAANSVEMLSGVGGNGPVAVKGETFLLETPAESYRLACRDDMPAESTIERTASAKEEPVASHGTAPGSAWELRECITSQTTVSGDSDGDVRRENDASAPKRAMGMWQAVLVMTQFSTAGALVVMPFAFGVLGYIAGPLLLALWLGAVGYCSYRMYLEIIVRPNIYTLGDLGQALFGATGRRLLHSGQLSSSILGPASLLVLTVDGVVAAGADSGNEGVLGSCRAFWVLGIWAALVLVLQVVRTIGSGVHQIALPSVALIVLKAVLIAEQAFATADV